MKANTEANIRKRVDRMVKETAQEIAKVAEGLAPKRTGRLADSIEAVAYEDMWRVVVGADYARFVEYGTYKMAAQPFLRPAIDSVNSRLRRRLGQLQAQLGSDLGVGVTRIQRSRPDDE